MIFFSYKLTILSVICLVFLTTMTMCQEMCAESQRQFLCQSGECISKTLLCDGASNCLDGSDETIELCQSRSCSQDLDYIDTDPSHPWLFPDLGLEQRFRCSYGACVPNQFVCDGIVHCVTDESDESEQQCNKEKCSHRQFRCDYGACILKRNACDNRMDCPDKSDETPEACRKIKKKCKANRDFKCDFGACVSKRYKCDNITHCLDGSDEWESVCGARPGLTLQSSTGSRVRNRQPSPPIVIRKIAHFDDLPPLSPSAVVEPETAQEKAVVTTSKSTNGGKGCALPDDFDIIFSIFQCGTHCDGDFMPAGTVMSVQCPDGDRALSCGLSGLWSFVRFPSRAPTEKPCQNKPSEVLSDTDGSLLAVLRTPLVSDCGRLAEGARMPWLVGIFRNGAFSCTGTIVGPTLVLTAGHCVVSDQATRERLIPASEFTIQVTSDNPDDPKTFIPVSLIEIHPLYTGGTSPYFDLALAFLGENVQQKKGLSSACLDTGGKLLKVPAWTFNRTEGQSFYRWDIFEQILDIDCFNKATICTRHLRIGQNQYCSINKRVPLYLHPGASGGPYFVSNEIDGVVRWAVAGVVSNTISTSGCGRRTVFTSVSRLRQWIIDCGFLAICSM